MGIIGDLFDRDMLKSQREAFSGRAGADAILEGAAAQERSANRAIDVQESFLDDLRTRTDPFREFGVGNLQALQRSLDRNNPLVQAVTDAARRPSNNVFASRLNNLNPTENPLLSRLNDLTSNPEEQAKFIQDNPFFNALAEKAQDDILSVQAAKGKLGTGGTLEALQDSRMRLGSGLLNQELANLRGGVAANEQVRGADFNRLLQGASLNDQLRGTNFNRLLQAAGVRSNQDAMNRNALFRAVGTGQNAATFQGSSGQQTGNQITNLLTGIGNAQAAGGVGAANAMAQGQRNIMGVVGAILSDPRFKQNIKPVGTLETDNGIYNTYEYNYVGSTDRVVSVMADEVEEINPEAVFRFHGVRYVNLARL